MKKPERKKEMTNSFLGGIPLITLEYFLFHLFNTSQIYTHLHLVHLSNNEYGGITFLSICFNWTQNGHKLRCYIIKRRLTSTHTCISDTGDWYYLRRWWNTASKIRTRRAYIKIQKNTQIKKIWIFPFLNNYS